MGLQDYRKGKWWRSRDLEWVLVQIRTIVLSKSRGHHFSGDFHQKIHEFFILYDICAVASLLEGERLEVAQFRVSASWNSNICDVGNPSNYYSDDFLWRIHGFFIFYDFCVVTKLLVGETLEVAQFRVIAGWYSNICDVGNTEPLWFQRLSLKNSILCNFCGVAGLLVGKTLEVAQFKVSTGWN